MSKRRILILAATAAVGLITACGAAGPGASSGPPTAKSVQAKVKSSTMRSAHFTMTATLADGANRYSANGTGVIQLSPSTAIEMNLQMETGTILGTIGVTEIIMNGVEYTQIGTEPWTSQPDTSASSITNPTKYVGEDQVAGTKAWHVLAESGDATYDMWVRESDGYLLKIQYASTDGSAWTMTFDSYNSGPAIAAPAVSPSP